jgi:hypothetical protein
MTDDRSSFFRVIVWSDELEIMDFGISGIH